MTTSKPVGLLFPLLAMLFVDFVNAGDPKRSGLQIDRTLEASFEDNDVEPANPCESWVFQRRVTLDLAGRVPTVEELNRFKRIPVKEVLVDELLASDEFNEYWSEIWTSILVGRRVTEATDREALRQWIEDAFRANVPFDQVAFDLISAEGVSSLNGPVNFLVGNQEDPVTSVSRVFLGVQLDCARCHDHPYDRWTQDDFESMQRFFEPLDFREVSGGFQIEDEPGSSDDTPRFLTGARPKTMAWRRELAFMTVRSKPFARAIGNRVWQILFGVGLVDPVDGLSQNDRPSVPELHNAMANYLRESNFDLKGLVKEIALSNAYSRSSDPPEPMTAPALRMARRLFAVRQPKLLLPEQLIRSYASITNASPVSPTQRNETAVDWIGRSAVRVGSSDPISFTRTSQGLLNELASRDRSVPENLDRLFEATLSRKPTTEERRGLSDENFQNLMYALLHCNEFVFCR
ncbi:MAG: DUF1549 domain-containing protein [Planctomycetota bacterium]